MPFSVKYCDGEWIVFNKDTQKIYGKHKTKDKAVRQLKAIYANYKEDVDDNISERIQKNVCDYTQINENNELLMKYHKHYKIPISELEKLWNKAQDLYNSDLEKENKKIDTGSQTYWTGVIKKFKELFSELELEEAKKIMETKETYKQKLTHWLNNIQTGNYAEAEKIFPSVIRSKVELIINNRKNIYLKQLAKKYNTVKDI